VPRFQGHHLGYLYQATGDVDGPIAAYSIDLSRQIGDLASAAGSMANLSQVLYAVGRREDAIALGEEARITSSNWARLGPSRSRLESNPGNTADS
jgi:hypothetical protein